ncbi:MAG: methyltransferase domain-containing protein [Caulobacteraceae bacterium]
MEDGGLANARDYYGKVLGGSRDLRTDACSTADRPGALVEAALRRVHPEVEARYYGCGLVAPAKLEGARVLDLGCGAGRDVYVLAQLVGARGAVVGVDATPEQLSVARQHAEWHREQFGYSRSNVTFVDGDITQLDTLGLQPESFDVIVSNCVINLVENKAAVFAAARALLKAGGEFYFADVYADRRLPEALKTDPVLHGECLAGALYWNDFQHLARASGFPDPRLVKSRALAITDATLASLLGAARFYSATYRLYNIPDLEPACEDYGQAVIYRGGVTGAETVFELDAHHRIEAGKVFAVCGNTWRMLRESRFTPHFEFIGDFARHFGIFPGCGAEAPFAEADVGAAPAPGCC